MRHKLSILLLTCTLMSGCNVANIIKMRFANDDLQPVWPSQQTQTRLATRFIGEKPYVYARINGGKTLLFQLDTGASMSYLFDTPATQNLALPKGYSMEIGGWGNGQDSQVHQSVLESLSLGPVRFHNVNIALAPISKSQYFARPDQAIFDGVLGHDIMRHFSWTFDKQANQISISSQPYQPTGNENSVPFETFFKKISLTANIDFGDGQKISQDLIIDTGSRHYIKASASYVANHIDLQGATVTSADFGLSGKAVHQRTSVPFVTIGAQQFAWVKTNLIGIDDDEDENWIVGSALLNQFVTVLDYHQSKLHILPNKSRTFRSRYNLLGLELRKLRGGEFILRYVSPDFAGAKHDLKAGDIVIEIDGKAAAEWSFEDWLSITATPGQHRLCVQRAQPVCFDMLAEHIPGYSIPAKDNSSPELNLL